MKKINKMFWVESILEVKEEYKKLMLEGKITRGYYSMTLRKLPFYESKELTIRCFMRKTKEELNSIYNDIRILIYKHE